MGFLRGARAFGRMASLRRTWRFISVCMDVSDRKNLGLIAAGVAFYAILSLFPGLAALIAVWGLIGNPKGLSDGLSAYDALLPAELVTVLQDQLETLAAADGLQLGWASVISFLLALWSARSGVAALMRGLNTIYGVSNRRGLPHYLRAIVLTIALIGVALTALVCIVVAPVILALFPPGFLVTLAVELGRWVLALAVLLAGFSMVYWLAPNRVEKIVLPGALLAAVLWAAVSAGFSIYLANFGSYNEVYGSIGAAVAMLTWLYLSAWLVLLGGALNAWLGQQQKPDPERADGQTG